MNLFCYLKYGLAAILTFVGVKMLVAHYVPLPVLASLAIIVLILSISMVASVIVTRRTEVCPVVDKVQIESCPVLKGLQEGEGVEDK